MTNIAVAAEEYAQSDGGALSADSCLNLWILTPTAIHVQRRAASEAICVRIVVSHLGMTCEIAQVQHCEGSSALSRRMSQSKR